MASDSIFHWARIESEGENFQALAGRLAETTIPAVRTTGGEPWMTANGLFGLWTNELILVTAWPQVSGATAIVGSNLPDGASIVQQYEFVATVRPANEVPPSRPGVYVHRLFEVNAADVERFVELSEEAWTTFEGAGGYQAEPQGLFRQREHAAEGGLMLLVTWYDRLESWERSRTPAPEAEANFRARAALTRKSMAFATRLVGTPGAPRGMGPG
jgi:hypothetical protein